MIPLGNDFDIILTYIPSSDEQYHPIKHDLKAHPEFPVGGAHLVGGANSRHENVSKNVYVKAKELGPLGEARAGCAPTGFANGIILIKKFFIILDSKLRFHSKIIQQFFSNLS